MGCLLLSHHPHPNPPLEGEGMREGLFRLIAIEQSTVIIAPLKTLLISLQTEIQEYKTSPPLQGEEIQETASSDNISL